VLFDTRGLGVEVIHPDWEWLHRNQKKIEALILTHGHEDHIGAVSYFLRDFDVPVYGSPYPVALVRSRVAEHVWHRSRKFDWRVVDEKSVFEAAGMRFHLWQVTHSMPDSYGLVVETKEGIVVHTGDFKIDSQPPPGDRFAWERLAPFVEKGVALLLSDSTNALAEGEAGSELKVGEALDEIISRATARVVVGLFSSNIHRVRMLCDVARKVGRWVVPLGRSVETHLKIAVELGLLPDPRDVLLSREQLKQLPPHRTLVLATGSQGEPQAALPRLAAGQHPDLELSPGDIVILSSRIIPGNERAVYELIESFERRGIHVITRAIDSRVHVSGHAHREEQRALVEWIKPGAFMPVHGTYVHLRTHAELARSAGVAQVVVALNGDVVELRNGVLRLIGRVPSGRVHIDHGGEPVDERVLAERRSLAEWGEAIASFVVDVRGELVGAPKIMTRGLFVEHEEPELLRDASKAVARAIREAQDGRDRVDVSMLEESARRALRRFFLEELSKRPLISIFCHRLSHRVYNMRK
ncbi:MAG: ribonuclease J, partial [Deltaproteobacteria bacterium]|nr:ribonuclease J [Deltaproteobacteria bacterium]